MSGRVEHEHLLYDQLRPNEAGTAGLTRVRHELRHRTARMRHDDLLTLTDAAEKM